jgi:hypothetical protein
LIAHLLYNSHVVTFLLGALSCVIARYLNFQTFSAIWRPIYNYIMTMSIKDVLSFVYRPTYLHGTCFLTCKETLHFSLQTSESLQH